MSWRSQAPERPLVLLLGWLGCSERHLHKYSTLWQDLGAAHVVTHRPTILQTAVPSVGDRALLALMQDVTQRYSTLCSLRGGAPPMLVHAMSNAGFLAYGSALHLVSLLKQQPTSPRQQQQQQSYAGGGGSSLSLQFGPTATVGWRGGMAARSPEAALGDGGTVTGSSSSMNGSSNDSSSSRSRWWPGSGGGKHEGAVPAAAAAPHPFLSDPGALAVLSAFKQVLGAQRGVVVDSAPSLALPEIYCRGLVSALLSQSADGIEERHPLLVRSARGFVERYLALPRITHRFGEIWQAWQWHVPPCPQLYLYSRADALIPAAHVDFFMEQQAAHGAPVHHHCWDDSPHCEHFRVHREQYRSIIASFEQHACRYTAPPESWI